MMMMTNPIVIVQTRIRSKFKTNFFSEKNGKVSEKQVEEEDESDKAGQIWRKGKKFIFCLVEVSSFI